MSTFDHSILTVFCALIGLVALIGNGMLSGAANAAPAIYRHGLLVAFVMAFVAIGNWWL